MELYFQLKYIFTYIYKEDINRCSSFEAQVKCNLVGNPIPYD